MPKDKIPDPILPAYPKEIQKIQQWKNYQKNPDIFQSYLAQHL
jgi:hypothetical protein